MTLADLGGIYRSRVGRSTLSAQSGPTDFMSYKSAILREPSHIHVRTYAMHRQYVSATFCSGARTVPAESRASLPVLACEQRTRIARSTFVYRDAG